jgi:uncharacterized lipoprotein YmbA
MTRSGICLIVNASLLLLSGGCTNLSKPNVPQDRYALKIEQINPVEQAQLEVALRVRRVVVSEPYEESAFTYHTGSSKITQDYYHQFVAPPASLITEVLIEGLGATGRFRVVVSDRSSIVTPYLLEGQILEISGHYDDPGSPEAVLRAKFFLLKEHGRTTSLLMTKEYERTRSLSDDNRASLVAGWNQALGELVVRLAEDVAAAIESQQAGEADSR